MYLPYDNGPEFFSEYLAHCESSQMMPNTFAKRETFRKVFKSMKNEFRLIGGKGSFATTQMIFYAI
jgi:hypothetical protein